MTRRGSSVNPTFATGTFDTIGSIPVIIPRIPPNEQTARLSVEKRKKGKVVTVVRGLSSDGNELPELLTQLKSTCGAGGTLKEGTLEIQGNHLDRLRNVMGEIGYRVKG